MTLKLITQMGCKKKLFGVCSESTVRAHNSPTELNEGPEIFVPANQIKMGEAHPNLIRPEFLDGLQAGPRQAGLEIHLSHTRNYFRQPPTRFKP